MRSRGTSYGPREPQERHPTRPRTRPAPQKRAASKSGSARPPETARAPAASNEHLPWKHSAPAERLHQEDRPLPTPETAGARAPEKAGAPAAKKAGTRAAKK
jgi:hypothetical protein